MDSSRSGLLSTLLMTLPLIVVPAIALLRPPGQATGVSTSSLDASESSDDDFLNDLSDLEMAIEDPEKSTEQPSLKDSPEFDGLFTESEEKSGDESLPADSTEADSRTGRRDRNKTENKSDESFVPLDFQDRDSPARDPRIAENPGGTAEQIVEHLNSKGALRTMWFEAGPKSPVGFAVFFRGQTELMRIRFEAVGQTREECARNVFDQVAQWQAEQTAPGQ